MAVTDLVMLDIKHIDNEKHKVSLSIRALIEPEEEADEAPVEEAAEEVADAE